EDGPDDSLVMSRPAAELKESWLAGLKHERRVSPHTLRAYGDDVERFFAFLTAHRGARPSLTMLQKLKPSDIRAFLTQRRASGLGARGIQRLVAAIRSFFRYLERENLADGAAVRAVNSPKLPRTLPRPLSETDAARAIAEAGEDEKPWIAARNAALIT